MPKVICTLPNASDLISGVAFTKHPRGMISEDIPDEHAKHFASIAGYEIDGADIDALRARADALGIDYKGNWKQDRLRAEIERAAEKKAEEEASTRHAAGQHGGDDANTETV